MKILYIHNEYARMSGEEHASGELVALLEEHGHKVRWFTRSSAEISDSTKGKIKAFFAGIYNPNSAKRLAKVLDEFKPDVVQVQNLYPLISTSIFKPLKKRKIPVVMRCPNYRLFCPNGLSLDLNGEVCEKCWGKGHEWWCIKKKCEGSLFKSVGYAARNYIARISQNIINGVDLFIVQSQFQKDKFISMGILPEKIGILPGISPVITTPIDESINGKWVSFVGRVSSEKGIYEFIDAARSNPNIPFKVAGNIDAAFSIPNDLPSNLEFVGFLKGDDLNRFYQESRIIVVPSKWYEGFPNVIVRGMLLKRPVVTTAIGAMQSIIDDGINGILVPPADSIALSNAISGLYNDLERCQIYGAAGYEKAQSQYSREEVYSNLCQIYKTAIESQNYNK